MKPIAPVTCWQAAQACADRGPGMGQGIGVLEPFGARARARAGQQPYSPHRGRGPREQLLDGGQGGQSAPKGVALANVVVRQIEGALAQPGEIAHSSGQPGALGDPPAVSGQLDPVTQLQHPVQIEPFGGGHGLGSQHRSAQHSTMLTDDRGRPRAERPAETAGHRTAAQQAVDAVQGSQPVPELDGAQAGAGDEFGVLRQGVPTELGQCGGELGPRSRRECAGLPATVHWGVPVDHASHALGERSRLVRFEAQARGWRHCASTSSVCSPNAGMQRLGGLTKPSILNSEPSSLTSPTSSW